MKLVNLEDKYPCHCSHASWRHGYCDYQDVCWQCLEIVEKTMTIPYHPGHKFKADNLRYLEEVSKNG